jgi:hypothetical protein
MTSRGRFHCCATLYPQRELGSVSKTQKLRGKIYFFVHGVRGGTGSRAGLRGARDVVGVSAAVIVASSLNS